MNKSEFTIKLTERQFIQTNALLKRRFTCGICGKKSSKEQRYIGAQPSSSECSTWQGMVPKTLLVSIFCKPCGSSVSNHVRSLRVRK